MAEAINEHEGEKDFLDTLVKIHQDDLKTEYVGGGGKRPQG